VLSVPAFRAAFDKHFLEKLVVHVQEPIVRRAGESAEEFRDVTLRFVADPRIHSEICEVIDDAVYDYLHGEASSTCPTTGATCCSGDSERARGPPSSRGDSCVVRRHP